MVTFWRVLTQMMQTTQIVWIRARVGEVTSLLVTKKRAHQFICQNQRHIKTLYLPFIPLHTNENLRQLKITKTKPKTSNQYNSSLCTNKRLTSRCTKTSRFLWLRENDVTKCMFTWSESDRCLDTWRSRELCISITFLVAFEFRVAV